MTFFIDISCRPDFTVNRCLFSLFDTKTRPTKKPIHGVTSSDITVDASKNLWFRLYRPVAVDSAGPVLPVIVFFHGGGFAFLGADSKPYDEFCFRLVRELSVVVISVNYRLSPEHKWPSQYEDGFDVLKFLDDEKIEDFNTFADLNHCFLAGDSAGGNIPHHVVVKSSDFSFQTVKHVGVIAIQPFFGGEERTASELMKAPVVSPDRTDWIWKAFLPDGSNRDHPAANVFGPNEADLSRVEFPATMVVVGGFDPLRDWQRRYYEGLKRAGKEAYLVEYPKAVHSFYAFPELPESSLMIKEVRDFIQRVVKANLIFLTSLIHVSCSCCCLFQSCCCWQMYNFS